MAESQPVAVFSIGLLILAMIVVPWLLRKLFF
jgi:hypothetical protein